MQSDTARQQDRMALESGRCAPGSHRSPPWLLLHGAGGGAWECLKWRRVLEAEAVPVCSADFSLAASQTSDFARVCEVVAAQAAPLPQPVVVGASFGALLAIALADRLAASAVVLINPLPPAPFASAGAGERKGAAASLPWLRRWGLDARLAGTRRSIPELSGAEALFAFRRWRDFDARLLATARAGLPLSRPASPLLCVISRGDAELPPADGLRLAVAWRAELIECEGSHVAPLLGPSAAALARRALDWSRALSAG